MTITPISYDEAQLLYPSQRARDGSPEVERARALGPGEGIVIAPCPCRARPPHAWSEKYQRCLLAAKLGSSLRSQGKRADVWHSKDALIVVRKPE